MKFECQESCGGQCCKIPKGKTMFVYLTMADRLRLATFLKQPVSQFAQKASFFFTRFSRAGIYWFLKIKAGSDQCPFLFNGKCRVYEARPDQCRTWPFWPENLKKETEEHFIKACPGIGVGPEYDMEKEIQEQARTDGLYSNQDRRTNPDFRQQP